MEPNQKQYPGSYQDPDVIDAEQLSLAAYHLIEAGYGDQAMFFIDLVCKSFESVSCDVKRKDPAKIMGNVLYFPYGVIRIKTSPYDLSIPAPAYSIELKAGKAKTDAIKRGSDECRRIRFGWFPSKQATAAASGKLPNTASFRPAVLLSKMLSLTEASTAEMPNQGRLMLSQKLSHVLLKNPISKDKYTKLLADLYDYGDSRYSYNDNESYGFAYLTKAQTEIAADIIARDSPTMARELNGIEINVVKWKGLSSDATSLLYDPLNSSSEKDLKEIPFLAKHKAAYQEKYYGNRRYVGYASTPEYRLSGILHTAMDAAVDAANLQRCHAALCRCGDDYLVDILTRTKMIDTELDAKLDPGFWKSVGRLMLQNVWAADVDAGKELIAMAMDAFEIIMARPELAVKADSDLIRPPVKAEKPSGETSS